MPRNERGGRGARNGRSRSTPREGFPTGTTSVPTPYLSLLDEARNTGRKQFWNADLKLRHTQVTFVSAGVSGEMTAQPEIGTILWPNAPCMKDSTKKNATYSDPEQSMADMSLDPRTQVTPPMDPSIFPYMLGEPPTGFKNLDGTEEEDRTRIRNSEFLSIDSSGYDRVLAPVLPMSSICRPDSPSSGSDDEIVLFRGRGCSRQPDGTMSDSFATPTHSSTGTHYQCSRASATRLDPAIQFPSTRVVSDSLSVPRTHPYQKETQVGVLDAPETISNTSRGLARARHARNKRADEGIADYISNIQQNVKLDQHSSFGSWHRRDLDNLALNFVQDEVEPSVSEDEPALVVSRGVSDTDLHGIDDLSTSSEILKANCSILAKRERLSGVQYLVVWEGHTTDNAKWIPYTLLNTVAAAEMIAKFEAQERLTTQVVMDDNDTCSDSDEVNQVAQDKARDTLSMKEPEKGPKTMKASMTDEQMALRLAKQEQLGLDSAEVVLFDGDELECWADEDNLKKLRAQATQYTQLGKPKRGKSRTPYASASVFADVLVQDPYNGFDIMDLDRPSLRKRPKGRRGVLPLELSDSELETSMRLAWDNDRTKKKLQKQDREELRAQGLFGKRDKVDMKYKYKEGMSINQMKSEVKNFLMSDRVSVSFPPMGKKDRKLVHEFASIFNLKSKSNGGGRSRYPTLFKTSRSIQFSEGKLEDVEILLDQRRFLPRLDKGLKRGSGTRKPAGRSGTVSGAAVAYRDGEIVGAAAPELGTDNKGRAMLERMGWSTGTALGALNNKGIMLPVVHIVKTTKAGLG